MDGNISLTGRMHEMNWKEGKKVIHDKGQLPLEILGMLVGCFTIYGALLATGAWIYGNTGTASVLSVLVVAACFGLFKIWEKIKLSKLQRL